MKPLGIKLFVIAVAMFAATSAFADSTYDFSADTYSIDGQSGYIDMQFNPGASSTGAASAVITNFISDATLGVVSPSGDVTGTLPGTVTINNTTQFNDYFQEVTFGDTVTFDLDLSSAPGNTFALSFFQSDGATPLLTTDLTDGYATTIDLNQTGPAVTNFSNQVTAEPVTTTPEPSTLLLVGSTLGLAGLVGLKRKVLEMI
ncbi:MAG: NF038129 family PEP-CTERM protein [Syntrophobacteraceae bacterium]